MSHPFAPRWAFVTTSSFPFTHCGKPHNLPGVSQSPTASNWSQNQRGLQVLCSGAYQWVHTAEPEGKPIKKPLIKGGSALNKTWTGTVFLHHICRDLGLLRWWCKLSWKYSLWSLRCPEVAVCKFFWSTVLKSCDRCSVSEQPIQNYFLMKCTQKRKSHKNWFCLKFGASFLKSTVLE